MISYIFLSNFNDPYIGNGHIINIGSYIGYNSSTEYIFQATTAIRIFYYNLSLAQLIPGLLQNSHSIISFYWNFVFNIFIGSQIK